MPKRASRANTLKTIDNKGVSDDDGQTARRENCAIRDAVAQLKTKWRRFDGASSACFL